MSEKETDLHPITHITTDAIGPPGKRVFYIQGWKEERMVTLIVEKLQIQSLAVGLEQFLAELNEKFPDLPDASAEYNQDKMHIHPPVDPLFRTGELSLGYDTDNDLVVLIANELLRDDQDPEEGRVVRFWCTRSQIRAMCHWGMEVASSGRPICPQCGQPEEPEGHFCPKKNGHEH
ncbi:MAG: DUF3090 domain-containing protein [Anaerolineales bacterium]|nr:DUF3090 domain-containing protein [Anaerolineales bacterium]MCK5430509.1 DUF3090 domain-containing protein [Anaerolineales bacterium]